MAQQECKGGAQQPVSARLLGRCKTLHCPRLNFGPAQQKFTGQLVAAPNGIQLLTPSPLSKQVKQRNAQHPPRRPSRSQVRCTKKAASQKAARRQPSASATAPASFCALQACRRSARV